MSPAQPRHLWCDTCSRSLLPTELEQVRAGSGFIDVCPKCSHAVLAEGKAVEAAGAPDFPMRLLGAFAYPARLSTLGWMLVLLVVSWVVAFVPLLGGWIAAVVQVSYLFTIVRTTAAGQDDFAVVDDAGSGILDWIAPLARYCMALLVASLPAVAVAGATHRTDLALAPAVLGVVYLPAAMIVAAQGSGCLGPLNPLPAAVLIARIPGPYALTLAFLAVAGGATYGLTLAATWVVAALPLPLVPTLLAGLLRLVGPVVIARLLGLLAREHAEIVYG